MAEGTRRGVYATVFVLAVLGAVGLMTSALVADSVWRTTLQISSLLGVIVFGVVCSTLTWHRWNERDS